MTTKDNKLSCQSSSSDENSIPNQLLLLQQLSLNNKCNQNLSNTSIGGNSSAISAINYSNNNSGAGQLSTSVNMKRTNGGNSSLASSQHGRWTKEEHHKFLEGIKRYGKNWKKVEDHIGTRSGAQIRSHAQKFFNRLEKEFGKSSILKEMQSTGNTEGQASFTCEQTLTQGMSVQKQQQQKSLKIDLGSTIPADYAQQLLKIERQQEFYEDVTPTNSHVNSSQESDDIQQIPHNIFSQINSVQLNLKQKENVEAPPQKKDWSKILSAQEKMRQAGSSYNSISSGSNPLIMNKKEKKYAFKNEMKTNKHLSQLLDQQYQHLTDNIPYENQANKEIDQDSLNTLGNDQEVSPSDFIGQSLLNSIFEPADIEGHLIQFYIAQMNLEKYVNQKKQYELDSISPYMQNQIEKKKKLSIDSVSTCSAYNNNTTQNSLTNNFDNISSSQLSHSTVKITTSPSSQAFSTLINKQVLPQQNIKPNQPQIQQKPRATTQQKLQGLVKSHQLKQQNQNQEINEISEYQQSLMLFNMLQNLSSSSQQGSQENVKKQFNFNSILENERQDSNKNKEKVNKQFHNDVKSSQQSTQNSQEDMEAELLKQLLQNLSKKQSNQFQQQYPTQQQVSQKQNHFKIPSAPNCLNSKNEQPLNFTSTEEDEDDENYNIKLLQQKFMSVLTSQLASQNECQKFHN